MLTRNQLFSRIDEIIERSYTNFLFDVVGDDFFTDEQKRKIEGLGLIIGRRPLLELLYLLIRQRPTEGYAKDATLNQLLDQVAHSGILPVIADTQQSTLDTGKADFFQAIDATKSELRKQLQQRIVEANREYKKRLTVKRYVSVHEDETKKMDHLAALLIAIPLIAPAIQKQFERAFTTGLTSFINESTVDKIPEQTLITQEKPGEILVFKTVINDGSLCQWCHKFYTRGGKPIVYKLSELQANGSNYGKPKSEWKPTVGSTHPFCRCQLHLYNAKRQS